MRKPSKNVELVLVSALNILYVINLICSNAVLTYKVYKKGAFTLELGIE